MSAAPFHLCYTLTRRQRLAPHITPWSPCLAASFGFTLGILYLAQVVTLWFFVALVGPLLLCRGFVLLVFEIAVRSEHLVELLVDSVELELRTGSQTVRFPLDGIIQVFRSGKGMWTVLHTDNTAVVIPASAITTDQLDYLKGFALRAAEARKLATAPDVSR